MGRHQNVVGELDRGLPDRGKDTRAIYAVGWLRLLDGPHVH